MGVKNFLVAPSPRPPHLGRARRLHTPARRPHPPAGALTVPPSMPPSSSPVRAQANEAGSLVEVELQVTMARLEEEFRQLLIRGTASLAPVDLHVVPSAPSVCEHGGHPLCAGNSDGWFACASCDCGSSVAPTFSLAGAARGAWQGPACIQRRHWWDLVGREQKRGHASG